MFAAEIRKSRNGEMRPCRWRLHLGVMFVKINGEMQYLWRVMDHLGEVLENSVSNNSNNKAALKSLGNEMRKHGRPEAIVTDKLRSYGAALKELGADNRQETGRWANNRAENSHLPFRRRERAMQRFRRMRSLQKFAAVHASVSNHFNQDRSLSSRPLQTQLHRRSRRVAWSPLGIRDSHPALGETGSNPSDSTAICYD